MNKIININATKQTHPSEARFLSSLVTLFVLFKGLDLNDLFEKKF